MTEREIRQLLEQVCEEIDRCGRLARQVILPTTVGAAVALTSCAGKTPQEAKAEPGGVKDTQSQLKSDEPRPDTTAESKTKGADGTQTNEQEPIDPDGTEITESQDPVRANEIVPDPREARPYRYEIPKPYMAPDAEPLYRSFAG